MATYRESFNSAGESSTEQIEEPSDFGTRPQDQVAYWLAQDKVAEKTERNWIKQGKKIIKRYRDDRGANYGDVHRYNSLWSNVQTIRPAIFNKTPKPDVTRRYKDGDATGRMACDLLEQCISTSLDDCDFESQMQGTVTDYLLPGRGTMRILYVPHFGDEIPPEPNNDDLEESGSAAIVADEGDSSEGLAERPKPQQLHQREVVWEEAKLQYCFWEDYREGPARRWQEVPWIRYRAFLTKDELIDRFGAKTGNAVNLDTVTHAQNSGDTKPSDPIQSLFKRAEVWEVWDKTERRVLWLAPNSAELGLLDQVDDPLGLPDFFANPDPLLATITTDTRIPVADFIEYQDQAFEMDTLTARIDRLTRALKVSGIYAGEEKQVLQQLVDDGTENKLIPVNDWAAFAGDKGGLSNLIEWMPIQQVAETLIQLYDARDRTKEIMYEITGMSDIMRGASNPVETATAQQIKSQYGTLRLSDRQRAINRFARDCIRLVGWVISGQFSTQTISMMTGYPQCLLKPIPPPPQGPQMVMDGQTGQMQPSPVMQQYQQAVAPIQQANQAAIQQFQQACELLKSDMPHGFRIDIESDSTLAGDEAQQKQDATEFLGALVPLLEQVIPVAQGNPAMAPVARELVLFAVRNFRAGRPLEETLEKAFDALAQMPPPQQQGQQGAQSDPAAAEAAVAGKQVQAQSAMQIAQINAGVNQQKNQQTFALTQQKNQTDASYKAASLQLQQQKQDAEQRLEAARIVSTERQNAQALD